MVVVAVVVVFFLSCLIYSNHPQISKTLLSIQADFNSAVVWMTSFVPPVHPVSFPGT